MTQAARYAIYLAPPPESALWRFGSAAIGRDATGAALEPFELEAFSAQAWREMTAEPRRYGFHATIKAPFRLRDGETFERLCAAAEVLAAAQAPFELGPLEVTRIASGAERAFIALTPRAPCADLTRLESLVVRQLDRFRAPLTPTERARRRPERLTERQRDMLERWGYPYALDEFRVHFTLTDAIAESEPVARALADAFAVRAASPSLAVDALVLFAQGQAGEDFVVLRRFPFAAA